MNGSIAPGQNPASRNGGDANLSDFTSQSWIEQNLNWDFYEVWGMSDADDPVNKGLPVLKALPNNRPTNVPFIAQDRPAFVAVFPNPVSDVFRIIGGKENVELTVTDLGGKTVLQRTVAPCEPVSVQGWPAGVYIVHAGGEVLKMIKK